MQQSFRKGVRSLENANSTVNSLILTDVDCNVCNLTFRARLLCLTWFVRRSPTRPAVRHLCRSRQRTGYISSHLSTFLGTQRQW